MAKLSKKEADLLKSLQAKAEAPDAPPSQRVLNVSIDLGDPAQVERATKLGLLDGIEDDGDEGAGDEEEEEADDGPKRKGYFKE